MHFVVERYITDPLLVSLAFAVAIGEAAILCWCLTRMGGVFAKAVAPGEKVASLEGLRGLLAFSVVIHHACCWYFFMQIGVWETGHSILFNRVARFGVMQFFYISGYLFWRKLMRRGKIPLGRFYLSRFIRIGPVYYACVGTAILIGITVTGLGVRVSPAELGRSLAAWLFFTLGGRASVNGADVIRITAGVTWTLAMEWGFYLLLPFLGWFTGRTRRLFWYAVICVAVWAVAKDLSRVLAHMEHFVVEIEMVAKLAKFMLIGFGGGILVAALDSRLRKMNKLSPRQASWLLAVLYLVYLLVPGIQSLGEILLLCGFALVVQGTDLFGLIASRPVRLLGIVSYPIYLVHGVIYYLATRVRGGIHPVPLRVYIPETLLCMVIVVLVATALHFAVERPTMLLSERISRGDKARAEAPRPVAA